MATTIKLKNSVTATNAPSSLVQGEVAINVTDKKVWVGNAATTPIQLLGGGADGSFTNISVSGVASFADGTVSLPSITNIGDTNTGIFFPAADTIAFTEGGVEAARFDSSGQLGIGTTSPAALLHTVKSTSGISAAFDNGGQAITEIDLWNNGVQKSAWYYDNTNSIAYLFATTGASLGFSSNGTERMRITSAGDVGIGTSSPTTQLSISKGSQGNNLNVRSRAYLGGTTSSDSLVLGYSVKADTGATDQMVGTETNSGGGAPAAILMNSGVIQFHTATSVTSGAAFSSERMRIDSSGNVGIGLTSVGAYRLNVSNNSVADDSLRVANARATSGDRVALFRLQANTANTSSRFLTCSGNDVAGNGDAFIIYGNGNAVNVNNSYGAISDIKLKENIVDTSPKLADLMQVKVRNYNLIGDTQKQIGVVAQELETVFPSMIDATPDKDAENNELGTTTKSVKYSVFVPILIKAIQEQQTIIENLTTRLNALEGN